MAEVRTVDRFLPTLDECITQGTRPRSTEPRLQHPVSVLATRTFRTTICAALSLAPIPAIAVEPGWVVETPHFRVLAREGPGLSAKEVASAAEDLEAIRSLCLRMGLGSPTRSDGPLDVLVVGTQLELHSLLRESPASKTRGITIRGLDRNYVVVPRHSSPGLRMTLAHEYAHQVEDPDWPRWLREGRAIYLARLMPTEPGEDVMESLLAELDRSSWVPWSDFLKDTSEQSTLNGELFQSQAWILVHWLVSTQASLARLGPELAFEAFINHGQEGLTDLVKAHIARLRTTGVVQGPALPRTREPVTIGKAEEWELSLIEAEVLRELRFLEQADGSLLQLVERHPKEARVQAAYASLMLVSNRHDEAERHFGIALECGDNRARTAFRYALLMMRPGPDAGTRSALALRFALYARDRMPDEPAHHLALAQARMLNTDWDGAYGELRRLAAFAGWGAVADREAREVERRRNQALRSVPSPSFDRPPIEPLTPVPPLE